MCIYRISDKRTYAIFIKHTNLRIYPVDVIQLFVKLNGIYGHHSTLAIESRIVAGGKDRSTG